MTVLPRAACRTDPVSGALRSPCLPRTARHRWSAYFRRLTLIIAAVVLTACASVPMPPPVADARASWEQRQAQLRPLDAWEIRGRMALRTADEGWQANVLWVRERERHNIDLTGPLGRGHLRVTQDGHGAVLRDSEQQTHFAATAQELLYRVTGWQVPIESLNYWIVGLPVPDTRTEEDLDSWGRLASLRQLGWDVRFVEYSRHGAYDLPSKLFIRRLAANDGREHPAGPNGELTEVRLVIERWAVNGRDP